MKKILYACRSTKGKLNGFFLEKEEKYFVLIYYEMDEMIEYEAIDFKGNLIDAGEGLDLPRITREMLDHEKFIADYSELYKYTKEWDDFPRNCSLIDAVVFGYPKQFKREQAQQMAVVFERKLRFEEGKYKGNNDVLPYYVLQNELREKVIKKDELSPVIKYIGGVEVAYNEQENRMVSAIVILDAESLEVVEKASHEIDITFPYVPGLFSFREIPPILEAFKKLKIRPDLIVCDGQGIAHPKNMGMASHLGLELNIPTIGCTQKRLVGVYDKSKLGQKRGATENLIWGSEIVGVALRTQDNIKPMFVSIGHKISLETAIDWVLKLCTQYQKPETNGRADQLVNQLLKERTEVDFWGDEE